MSKESKKKLDRSKNNEQLKEKFNDNVIESEEKKKFKIDHLMITLTSWAGRGAH